ncbi:MAG: hypothetical protein Q4B58_07740 [Bacteroidales bacterium]|nr:hypothetical protein [Bacteroidales bacterium]
MAPIVVDSLVDCAIADMNAGTIERVHVEARASNDSTAKAGVAGLVKLNQGTIYQCQSSLPVLATQGNSISVGKETKENYIGGIAAVSLSPSTTTMAIIEGCLVNASVNKADDNTTEIRGGGIAGLATGRLYNNTFEYGITVSQEPEFFKNIVFETEQSGVSAQGNGWPTEATNPTTEGGTDNVNVYSGTRYHAIIDCQKELDYVMKTSSFNKAGSNIRIAKDFAVDDNWTHGTLPSGDQYSPTASEDNVSFSLEGNDKTITLKGAMLFNHVMGEVKNLTLYVAKPLVAKPSIVGTSYTATDAMAPLAYAVYGEKAKLTHLKVKAADKTSVQAATAAGLVVWAYGGSTIEKCRVKVPVKMWLPTGVDSDSKRYAGGIVACVCQASVLECEFLGNGKEWVANADGSDIAIKYNNFYYGGIIGGAADKLKVKPEVTVKDCTSWYPDNEKISDADQSTKGSIIGLAKFSDNTSSSNAMAEGNEGNWWPQASAGTKTYFDTKEKAIGKRNAVEATYDNDF